MMVTFISQCEKNALSKTRRVLDAFANRIGDRTWQTIITQEGLNAVKKLLRKTASKNTAVSCHWVRSRNYSEMVWIVGNRRKFNQQGIIPVNTTQRNIINTEWENDWRYLPLIKSLTALAALFHDWGKASAYFQEKLNPKSKNAKKSDPLRHEWVSLLLLHAFINDSKSDEGWLERLANGKIDENALKAVIKNKEDIKPLNELPLAASVIGWLVLTHHRLPILNKEDKRKNPAERNDIFEQISKEWGYENPDNKQLEKCFEFPKGLLSQSEYWLKVLKKWASKMQGNLLLLQEVITNGSWRLILHYARLSLMLGDHHYSSQGNDEKWLPNIQLFANTDKKTQQYKQKLDEHLVKVAESALKIVHLLPAFEDEPQKAYDIKALKKQSTSEAYKWQDKAVEAIKNWKKGIAEAYKNKRYGFFSVNIASTGCGKTFANAKIMRVLSEDEESLRYTLALGLRTLTLQTGDEYRKRIELDNSELAVLIGSKAIQELHNQKLEKEREENIEESGSESAEPLLDEDEDINYECAIPETLLNTVLKEPRHEKFLYAPVLVCTIDHMMAATETKRGGRYILPCLRLMSSDLVIDEIDDFDGKDLIAIGRLIHLAGMLGRKVMISSATIPPDMAEGYFTVYREGWQLFAKTREVSSSIGCAWIDEFGTQVETISDSKIELQKAAKNYQTLHQNFIEKRIKKLKEKPSQRKAEIIPCSPIENPTDEENLTVESIYFETIKKAIIEKHQQHYTENSGKRVSFGVVRMANIRPCVDLTRYLANSDWPKDIAIKVMAYHSQQVLLIRSEQEKHLDAVLYRKGKNPFENAVIKNHLRTTQEPNIIFILIATPVEEIGRDHDFDWAVVEPSSFRSIIQLAGRVLRHRDTQPTEPNIALMQYNLKGFKSEKPAFCRPGYEKGCENYALSTHNLYDLIEKKILDAGINAIPRIQKNKSLESTKNLIDLEHYSIQQLLTDYSQAGPESMQGWITQHWWLTGLPQVLNPFRKKDEWEEKFYLVPCGDDEIGFEFKQKTVNGEETFPKYIININEENGISDDILWLNLDYKNLLEEQAEEYEKKCGKNIPISKIASRYGEIISQVFSDNDEFCYFPGLGLVKM